MKNELPVCPLNDGKGEDAWLEGLESLLEELKFDEELPFKNAEDIWEEVCYILEEEDLYLTDPQKVLVRALFDKVWPQFKG